MLYVADKCPTIYYLFINLLTYLKLNDYEQQGNCKRDAEEWC